MNRTIDQAARWTSRLERAGFEITTTTMTFELFDYSVVTVDAIHATGEEITFWLYVNEDLGFDTRFTRFSSALRYAARGLPARCLGTSTRYIVDMIVDDAIDNVNFLLPFPSGVSA